MDHARRLLNSVKLSLHVKRGLQNIVRTAALLGFACAMAPHPVAAASITFVQGNYACPQSSTQASVAVKYNSAQTSGNLNVVVVGWNDSTATVSSVTDSAGNVYQRAVGPTTLSGFLGQSIYYAKNIANAAAGANTVTVAFTPFAAYPDIRVLEYNGADTVNPVDVFAAATGNNAATNSGSVTTTTASDLIFGANTVLTHNTGAGTGFTSRMITSPDGDIAEDKMVTAVGSYNATAPIQSGRWVMQMVAFRTPTIIGGDTQAPSAPSNLAATAAGGTQINLVWTASTDNVGVTNYLVERCQGVGCSSFTQIATPTTNSFSDSGLTNTSSYSYRVRATDAAANLSGYSNTATAQTADTQAPTAPSSLTATSVSNPTFGLGAQLSWTASTDNVGITQYLIERCQGASCTNFSQINTSTTNGYSDFPVLANTAYRYRVRATDAAANLSSYSNIVNFTFTDTNPPSTPSNLGATPISGGQINLTWTGSIDDVAVTNYLIERCLVSSCTFAQVGTSTSANFSDTGLTPSTAYSYRVRATDAANNLSGYSNTATTSTQADSQPPTAPSNLAATSAWSNGPAAQLNWTASTDNVAVAQYLIERCQGTSCTAFAQVATSTSPSFLDIGAGLVANSYRVRAADSAGNLSGYSNVVANFTWSDTTPPTAPSSLAATATSSTQINLSWTASTDNAGIPSYQIEQCLTAGCTFTQIGTSGTTTFNATGLTANTGYSYRVRATDTSNNLSGYSNTASATTQAAPDTQAPTAPSSLTATTASSTQINLSWAASTDNVAVTNYLIERCQGVGCSTFTQIGTSTITTFNSVGLTAGTSYSYQVRATDAAGNLSGYSNVGTATTSSTPAGLVAAYSFDENAGTTVTDASGSGGTGTLQGASWTAAGKYGNALSFNGTTSYVDLGNPSALQLTGSMTVEAWVKAAANPADDGQIVAKANSAGGWQLKTSPDTGPHTFGVKIAGSSSVQRYSTTVRALNTWYHVASVYNASTRALDIYVNGVLDNGTILGTVPASQILQAVNVNVGRRTGGFYFNGIIDEVRIYNRALSQSEIQTDMNTPIGSGTPPVDTQAPSAPSALSATAASSSQINLSWTASTDNVGVTNYLIESCTGASCSNFTQIGTSSGTTFSNTGLATGSSYSYRVRATDAAGNTSSYSNTATTTTQSPDTQNPTTPTNLSATAISGSQINLSWTASTDNVGVTGYLIERCTGTGCSSFARLTTVPSTNYSDTGLLSNTNYTYQVKATDAAGNFSAYSNLATTTTLNTLSGLVAAYTFDEGTGTSVTDLSGNGNTGTVVSATWVTTGKFGKALSFNGDTSIVNIPDSATLHLTTGMTLEAWVNPTTVSANWRDVVYKGNDNYFLEATSDHSGFPSAGIISGSAHPTIFGSALLPVNAWTHLATTYNGTTLILYVNGLQVSSVPQNGNIVTSTNPLQIGGDSIFGQRFSGLIDEVRVYNTALNQNQIQADMGTPVGGGGTLPFVSLNPTSLSFGNQQSGTQSGALPVTLTNIGGAPLTINNIAISGGNATEFTQINNCGATLNTGASCTINVVFAPTTTGARVSALVITDNAAGSPHSVNLSGTATGFQVNPRVAVVTSQQTQQFSVSSGTVTWSVDGVSGGSTTLGTVTSTGLYTPPSTAGSHTVTATVVGQGLSANATVYVSNHPGIFTYHNDNMRSGANSNEIVLTPSNVNQSQFGKLFSYSMDGVAYASPLYVANVNIPGQGVHNVVYVATEHDSVYAFDADGLSANPLWQVSFLTGGATTVPCGDTGECGDIASELGITGTPTIDQATGTLYVVAKTKESGNYVQRLHALDITTGAEKFNGPVVISGSVPGTGNGATGGQVPFHPLRENQRPALALVNGVVYITFASHGDQQPWHGWVLGYNATTLAQTMIFCVSPNGYGGGIWQSGEAPASDASGNIFVVTGNGNFNANSGGKDYGDTILQLTPSGLVDDYFTPHDQANLENQNFDLSSAGPVLLVDQPGTVPHLLIAAAKGGTIYVINRDNMGKFQSGSDSQIVQVIPDAVRHGGSEDGNYSPPVFFNNRVYFGAVLDTLKTFQLVSGKLTTTPTSQSTDTYPNRGGSFAISANGTSNTILWAMQDNNPSNGVLRAYDANNLTNALYNSTQAGSRDTFGLATKFSIPLVVNGKVYIVSQGQLVAFGLLP